MASERELSIAFFVTAESSFLGALWKIERLEEQMMAKNQAEQAASDKKKKKGTIQRSFFIIVAHYNIAEVKQQNNKTAYILLFSLCKICYNL